MSFLNSALAAPRGVMAVKTQVTTYVNLRNQKILIPNKLRKKYGHLIEQTFEPCNKLLVPNNSNKDESISKNNNNNSENNNGNEKDKLTENDPRLLEFYAEVNFSDNNEQINKKPTIINKKKRKYLSAVVEDINLDDDDIDGRHERTELLGYYDEKDQEQESDETYGSSYQYQYQYPFSPINHHSSLNYGHSRYYYTRQQSKKSIYSSCFDINPLYPSPPSIDFTFKCPTTFSLNLNNNNDNKNDGYNGTNLAVYLRPNGTYSGSIFNIDEGRYKMNDGYHDINSNDFLTTTVDNDFYINEKSNIDSRNTNSYSNLNTNQNTHNNNNNNQKSRSKLKSKSKSKSKSKKKTKKKWGRIKNTGEFWICEFCEYQSIFKTPPINMIKWYDKKEKIEAKRRRDWRRTLEKARGKNLKQQQHNNNNKLTDNDDDDDDDVNDDDLNDKSILNNNNNNNNNNNSNNKEQLYSLDLPNYDNNNHKSTRLESEFKSRPPDH